VFRSRIRPEPQRLLSIGDTIEPVAAGMAHDFNNLVAVIQGWAQVGCQQSLEGTPAHDTFQRICTLARSATGLTDRILAAARGQAPDRQRTNLNELVSQTADSMRSLMGELVEIELALAPMLPSICADGIQIEQLLVNLCLNALDAMPRGGRIVLETRDIVISPKSRGIASQSRPGRYVRLSVSDTGSGIEGEILDRIFEPFFTTKELGKGTGLGLAIIDGIVKRHEGFIQVCTEPGRGTTFHVYLPTLVGSV
jgi:two-component system, cell cycle sensor histidine kinase and response regulator CckA